MLFNVFTWNSSRKKSRQASLTFYLEVSCSWGGVGRGSLTRLIGDNFLALFDEFVDSVLIGAR